ncbi:MAG: amino acid ABC transporter permease [Pseudomonadota bacterium]
MKEMLEQLLGAPEGVVLYQLLHATQFTMYLSLIAFIGGGIIGAGVALFHVMPSRAARIVAVSFIWLFQSTPLLMLLFILGLGVPRLIGVDVDPWIAAIAALTIYSSAYFADVWRGALESVPTGQWEGARALGLGFWHTLRRVVLPQALKISLAPTVGLMVQIIKGTSLAYIIGFNDLMAIGKRWANAPVEGTEPFIIFPIMALIYFCLCFPLSHWSRRLERRLGTTTPDAVRAMA